MGIRWREVTSAAASSGVESPPGDGTEGGEGGALAVPQEDDGLPPRQDVLGFDLDTEITTISLPGRKLNKF